MDIEVGKLDFSAESILYIWKWFLKTALVEKTPKSEVEEIKVKYSQFGVSWVEYERFSVVTEFILRDIGMYIGQAFVQSSELITWSYVSKPKNLVHENGFVDNGYNPQFRPQLEPIGAVRGQALRLLTNESKEADLFNLFTRWLDFVPTS